MSFYLPSDALQQASFRRLAPGVLAYSTNYKAWLFTALLEEGDVWWAQLTGDGSPVLRRLDAGDDSLALILPSYRIEFDPESVEDGRRERLANGVAFVSDGAFGFGALSSSARNYHAATAIGFDGTILKDVPQIGPVAYYRRWRIVTGDRQHPTPVFDVEGSSWSV